MRTLVLHPDDRSTDFLKEIYRDKDWTIVNDHRSLQSRKYVSHLIKDHDRIIMMGHGYPRGLFYTCIDPSMVYLLRQKDCICIWCNADQFVRRYGLTGFFTGMFISEVGEAQHFGITESQENITNSNELFAKLVHQYIDDTDMLHYNLKTLYVGESPVIKFNNDRLYYRDEESILAEKDLKDEMNDGLLIF